MNAIARPRLLSSPPLRNLFYLSVPPSQFQSDAVRHCSDVTVTHTQRTTIAGKHLEFPTWSLTLPLQQSLSRH